MPADVSNSAIQWIRVNDFSPGIQHRTNMTTALVPQNAPAKPGTAAFATFGCESLPSGGLGPLPWNPTLIAAGPQPVAPASTEFNRLAITSFHAGRFPIISGTAQAPVAGQDIKSQIFMGVAYYDTTIPHNYISTMVRLKNYLQPNAYDTIRSDSVGTGINSNTECYVPTRWDEYRTGVSTVVTAFASTRFDGLLFNGVNYVFPDPATLFVNSNAPTSAAIGPLFIAHQQRLLGFNFGSYGTGIAGAAGIQNDNLNWTAPVSLTQQAAGAFISGGGLLACVLGSSNASELDIIGSSGAYIVSGDINNPQVTKYSSVQGTNGSFCEPVYVPGIGLVYGSQGNGIWAYPGGQSSQLLSTNLPLDMWQVPSPTVGYLAGSNIVPHFGQFAYSPGYLFTPNNWIMNTTTGAWWRLSINNGAVFCPWFDITPQGYLVCATAYSTANTVYGSAQSSPVNSWQWTSQPIPISQDDGWSRLVELLLVFQSETITFGNNSITVNVTAFPNNAQQTQTFTVNADQNVHPVRLNMNSSMEGTHCTVQIIAAGPTTNPAPILHEFRLGVQSDNKPLKSAN